MLPVKDTGVEKGKLIYPPPVVTVEAATLSEVPSAAPDIELAISTYKLSDGEAVFFKPTSIESREKLPASVVI